MPIAYLHGQPWQAWTREERFFCSILYHHASKEPREFAAWIISTAKLSADPSGEWDVGYEVCLYRDLLWQVGLSARAGEFPPKRTFDLCLFGERDIVVIEAKVCEGFDREQNGWFLKDKSLIGKLPGLTGTRVHLVALASSKYFKNAEKYGEGTALEVFDGRVEWQRVADKYGDPRLARAEELYGLKPGSYRGD